MATNTLTMAEDYSQLDSLEESAYVFTKYLATIGLTLSLIIVFSLWRQKNKTKSRKSVQFAISSVVFSLLLYSVSLILSNDLLFPWQYDAKHLSFVSMVDSIEIIFYNLSKITFYCSFTYYLISVFDSKSKNKTKTFKITFLIIWMIFTCLIFVACSIVYLLGDISQQTTKEIAVTSTHHIHLAMSIMSQDIADSNDYAYYSQMYSSFIFFVIDAMYFIILLYCYIKQIKSNNHQIKSVVLLFMSCLIFWITCIILATNSPFKFCLPVIDVMSDDICLFLMFEQQTEIYQFWCKGCDYCCFKLVFRSKAYRTLTVDDSESELQNENEALM